MTWIFLKFSHKNTNSIFFEKVRKNTEQFFEILKNCKGLKLKKKSWKKIESFRARGRGGHFLDLNGDFHPKKNEKVTSYLKVHYRLKRKICRIYACICCNFLITTTFESIYITFLNSTIFLKMKKMMFFIKWEFLRFCHFSYV